LHIGEFWHINEFLHDIDTSNLVNGKPVYYLANKKNLSINPVSFPNIGYLGVVNSTNVRISDFSISRNGEGLLIAFSSDTLIERIEATNNFNGISLSESLRTTIRHSNFSYNYEGIFAYYSDYVIIEENTVSHNDQGIFLMGSNYGTVYHNNFVENGLSPGLYQARAIQSYNCHWDDGYPSGGNYWSDYEEGYPDAQELDGSGIWDTPYVIDGNNQDNYPLMEPWGLKPPSPAEATRELIETIETWNLSKGVETSLTSKLDNVIHMFEKGNEKGAIHKLIVLANQVEALRGKKLTTEQANHLIAEAQKIINLIEG